MVPAFDRSAVRVTLVVAASADGKVSTRDGAGPRFSSQADKAFLTRLRAAADAVVVGAGTVVNDDPAFAMPADLRDRRRDRGQPPTPVRAVISGRGTVDPASRLFQGHESPTLVFVTSAASVKARDALSRVASVYTSQADSHIDPAWVISTLATDHGCRNVLLEGGPELSGAFLTDGLIDEVYVTVCPVLVGGSGVPSAIGGAGLAFADRVGLRLLDVRIDSDVFLHYAVEPPV